MSVFFYTIEKLPVDLFHKSPPPPLVRGAKSIVILSEVKRSREISCQCTGPYYFLATLRDLLDVEGEEVLLGDWCWCVYEEVFGVACLGEGDDFADGVTSL